MWIHILNILPPDSIKLWRCSGFMASVLISGLSGPGSSPGQRHWARHFTLTVPLSTQVYKWVPANLMLGVTLRWTGTHQGRSRNAPVVASCYGNWDKLRLDGPLGSYTDFTFTTTALNLPKPICSIQLKKLVIKGDKWRFWLFFFAPN